MLKINETVTLSGDVTLNGTQAVSMTAGLGGDYPNISISVINKEVYKDNLEVCKQGVVEFVEKSFDRQFELQGGGINE